MEGLNSGAVSAPFAAAMDAEVIIVIGANPTINHPVAATYIKNAAKRGAKLIVIDPRRQTLSRHAHLHLAFKPGSDVALLNAMINTIITEGLTDEQYIAGYTEGYEDLKSRIKDFTPEQMEPICGIPAATLREVAGIMRGRELRSSFGAMGISSCSRHRQWALPDRPCLLTARSRPARPHPCRHTTSGASTPGLIPMFLQVTDGRAHGCANLENGGIRYGSPSRPTVVEIVNAAQPVKSPHGHEGENRRVDPKCSTPASVRKA